MAEIHDAEKGVHTSGSLNVIDGYVQDAMQYDQSSGDITILSKPSSFQKV